VEYQDELELNMTAMDFRLYDNALGRFHGVDLLAEVDYSGSPYSFGFNNPVFWSDPTGLSEDGNNRIATCPECPNTPKFKPAIDDPNREFDYDSELDIAIEVTVLDEVEVVATRSTKTSNSSVTSDPLFWINSSLGFSSLYVGYKANFHLQNEIWHLSKSGQVHNSFEKSWNKSKYKNVRTHQTSRLQLPRNISNGLAATSIIMTGVNVYRSGDLKGSDVLYATMAGISFTGVGSVVSGIFFVADFATMGISYLATGEAKSIGNYLDEKTNGGVILNKKDF
jgi:RHS repeat-associated protein